MNRIKRFLQRFVLLLLILASIEQVSSVTNIDSCEVLIIGGTTAALGAALASSSYVKTCLTEPTDWVGGQLTSEGLPAPDEAYHKVVDPVTNFTVDVSAISRDPANENPLFTAILKNASAGNWNPGRCWVSPTCMLPIDLINVINQEIELRSENLTVYYNSVPKTVTLDQSGRNIIGVEVIQRKSTGNRYQFTFLSQEISDWYSREDSAEYTKEILNFTGFSYITDATPFGDIMVLSNASYLQGIAERFDGDVSGQGGSDICGQSFTFDLAQQLMENVTDDVLVPNPPNSPVINDSWFGLEGYPWEEVVTYRRIKASPDEGSLTLVEPGDVTVQNWDGGNDQKWSYLFLSRESAKAQVQDWQGGISISSLIFGEALAVEYHRWFRKNSPPAWVNRTVISPETMNTTTGLAKMPYLRDTRRSVGINNFVVTVEDLAGPAEQIVATIFPDRVGLGAYDVDIHGLYGCNYPDYMINEEYTILPYYIPFRALTNRDIDNLLVAGRTMATSFLANAAMRLHPEEFTSGQAAGVAAAFAVQNNITTTQGIYSQIENLQEVVKQVTPIAYLINGTYYPSDEAEREREDLLRIFFSHEIYYPL